MSIFAKRLYMSKREEEYKMNKIKEEIDSLKTRIKILESQTSELLKVDEHEK